MLEGDRVICVATDWHSAFGKHMVLERGMRLCINHRANLNGVTFIGFEEIDEDDDGEQPLFMASGFRPEKLN